LTRAWPISAPGPPSWDAIQAAVTVSLFGAKPDEAKLAQWRDQGVERAIFTLPSEGRDTVLPLVDRYASFISKVG
jgi:hypothetical protein